MNALEIGVLEYGDGKELEYPCNKETVNNIII